MHSGTELKKGYLRLIPSVMPECGKNTTVTNYTVCLIDRVSSHLTCYVQV